MNMIKINKFNMDFNNYNQHSSLIIDVVDAVIIDGYLRIPFRHIPCYNLPLQTRLERTISRAIFIF